eukprot:5545243-Pleurochrysis_carterae.AAC.2
MDDDTSFALYADAHLDPTPVHPRHTSHDPWNNMNSYANVHVSPHFSYTDHRGKNGWDTDSDSSDSDSCSSSSRSSRSKSGSSGASKNGSESEDDNTDARDWHDKYERARFSFGAENITHRPSYDEHDDHR